MQKLRVLIPFLVAVLCTGCVSVVDRPVLTVLNADSELSGLEVVAYRNCIAEMHGARDAKLGTIPPALALISDVADTIFSCEYFEGEKMKVFGRVPRIGDKAVHAGYGYALADKSTVIGELLSSANIESYYDVAHMKVRVKKDYVHLDYADTNSIVYRVAMRSAFLPWRRVAVFALVDFKDGVKLYTMFLWVQAAHLTDEEVVHNFERMIMLVKPPKVREARN